MARHTAPWSARRWQLTGAAALVLVVLAGFFVWRAVDGGGDDTASGSACDPPVGDSSGTGQGSAPDSSFDQLGVALGSFPNTLSREQVVRDMTAMRQLGATSIRMEIDWSITETAPGTYDWTVADQVFDAADGLGLTPLVIITKTPDWARTDGEPTNRYAPTDPATYGDFAAEAVEHFRDRGNAGAHLWEIWNEPNYAEYLAVPTDYAKFAAMLRCSYSAIKSADPQSTVVLGGLLRGGSDTSGDYVLDTTFLQGVYDNDGGGSFDVLGYHPYFYGADPADPTGDSRSQGWNRIPAVHDVMVANGDEDKPIWVTEVGEPTGDSDRSATEDEQARHLESSVRRAHEYPYVQGFWWYTARDSGTDPQNSESNYGLLRNDGSPKPALFAFQAAAAAIAR
jgi:hypothetical protein